MLVLLYILWFIILLLLHDVLEAKGEHWPNYKTWRTLLVAGEVSFVVMSLTFAFIAVMCRSDPSRTSLLQALIK